MKERRKAGLVPAREQERAALALEPLADAYTKRFRYSDAAWAYDDLLAAQVA